MSCDVKELDLARFFDGELQSGAQMNLLRHIATCSSCAQNLRKLTAIREMLKKETPSAPDGLSAKIRLALANEAGGARVFKPRWWLVGLAASYASIALIAGAVGFFSADRQHNNDAINHGVMAAHVRALMQNARYQVASSDQHTVKPWFAGRAEFSPQVRDFAAQGYALAGGRMDYVDGHRVAAMVYRHDKHLIDLMMWPTARSDSSPQFSMSEGFHLASWVSGGMEARAISDMGPEEMKAFAGLASAP